MKKTAKALCLVLLLSLLTGCGSMPSTEELLSLVGLGGSAGQAAVPAAYPVINEVVSSNKRCLTDEAVGSPDWLELYNPTAAPVSLKGWGLSDNIYKPYKYTFGEITLQPGEYLLLYCCSNDGIEKTDVICTDFGLSKSGETLYLSDPYFEIRHEVSVPALQSDVSFARRNDGSFGYCAAPTPGAVNGDRILDDPAALFADAHPEALIFSELFPGTDTLPAWVELYNSGSEELRLENYHLSDRDTDLKRSTLPEATLAPGAYTVIFLSKDPAAGEIISGFNLGSRDRALYLSDSKGKLIRTLTIPEADLYPGMSMVFPSEGGVLYTTNPTPGAANSPDAAELPTLAPMDAADPLVISEVLRKSGTAAPDSTGEARPFAELYNRSAGDVSLKGYYLSDDPEHPAKWALPEMVMQSGSYLVIYLDAEENPPEGEIHAPFKLGSGETALYLFDYPGLKLFTMEVPEDLKKGLSVGQTDSGASVIYATPTPGYANSAPKAADEEPGLFFNTKGVYINEVSALSEVKSGTNDWIELKNGGDTDLDLTGWTITNDQDIPNKFSLTGVTVQAGGCCVIEATSHSSRQKDGVAPFGISASGETLYLFDGDGVLADTFKTGILRVGLTSGRAKDTKDGARVFFTSPTPGKENSSSCSAGYTRVPLFSETGLYHKGQPFDLVLSSPDGGRIYYTTNGKKPTTSSKEYTGPISISKNTVVRAIAVKDGLIQSDIVTYTYLFEDPHTLPVVCINGDQDNIDRVLKTKDRKNKAEREAVLSWYETDGTLGVTFPCGIKAKGAGTLSYAQKSMTIHLRGGYGQSSVTYPFFPGCQYTTFSALQIRNSGQDIGDHKTDARMRDAFAARAVQGMNIDNAQNTQVIVYLNGSYYGIYDFGEDQNASFLENHYGVDPEAVDVIRRNSTVLDGSNKDIKRVFDYAVNKNLSDDAVFAEFAQWIDVDYFTDYFIAQTYFINSDMFNQKYWRSWDYTVKWRPIFYDLDFVFNEGSSAKRNIIPSYFNEKGVPSNDGSLTYMNIYVGLNKNKAWRMQAAERYVEVIYRWFDPDRLLSIVDDLEAKMRPEMARHISKWKKPKSMSAWNDALEILRSRIKNRPQYALENMQKWFKISDSQMAEWKAKYSAMPKAPI